MLVFPAVNTERLILRRFRPDDLHAFLRYRNDPEVLRYDGLEPIDEVRARAFLAEQGMVPAAVPSIWMQIAVERPGSGLIGDLGFQVSEHTLGTAELGYRLAREWWGQGYGAEAVGGLLGWAFGSLGLHRVVALIDTRNDHSIRLVERLGFRREGTLIESYQEPDGWSDEYLYALLEREWRR